MLNETNKIKCSPMCCKYCGHSFKTMARLTTHITLCELKHNASSLSVKEEDELENIPSQKKMYKMLIDLTIKYNKLEEKVNEVHQYVVKKVKKIDIIEYLNKNITPPIYFSNIQSLININDDDIHYLFNNTVLNTISNLLTRALNGETALLGFIQKQNTIYHYTEDNIWTIIPREKLIKFFDTIQTRILTALNEWKNKNKELLDNDSSKCIIYNNTTIKLLTPDFKKESTLNKYINMLYSVIKKDMKGVLEYEFEF